MKKFLTVVKKPFKWYFNQLAKTYSLYPTGTIPARIVFGEDKK